MFHLWCNSKYTAGCTSQLCEQVGQKLGLQILKNLDKGRKAEGKSKNKTAQICSGLKLVASFNFEAVLIFATNCGKICDVLIFTAKFKEF